MLIPACCLALLFGALANQKPASSSTPAVPVSPLPHGLDSRLPVPIENPLTSAKIRLGEKLFFDARLSGDGKIACASCHDPKLAFSDGRPLARGVEGREGRRNAPSLLNTAYNKSFLWDGRAATLEQQALQPFTNSVEMGTPIETVLAKVNADASYRQAFRETFGPALKAVTADRLAAAIASYERSLVAADTAFDRYDRWGETSDLSKRAEIGWGDQEVQFRERERKEGCCLGK